MSRSGWLMYYWLLFILSLWPAIFAWLAFYVSRSRMWLLVALSKSALALIIGGLVIQFSPQTSDLINYLITRAQRGLLFLAVVGSIALVYFLLTMANGRLGNVRRAFLIPYRPIRLLQKHIQRMGDNGDDQKLDRGSVRS